MKTPLKLGGQKLTLAFLLLYSMCYNESIEWYLLFIVCTLDFKLTYAWSQYLNYK
jgi:hypothetical protein